MKIKIQSEEELLKIAEQAIKIIANLRKFTKLWEETHGVKLKERKKNWEATADRFIESLTMEELHRNEHIHIEINADTDTAKTH